MFISHYKLQLFFPFLVLLMNRISQIILFLASELTVFLFDLKKI